MGKVVRVSATSGIQPASGHRNPAPAGTGFGDWNHGAHFTIGTGRIQNGVDGKRFVDVVGGNPAARLDRHILHPVRGLARTVVRSVHRLPYPDTCSPAYTGPKSNLELKDSLILASSSPRRRALLESLGVNFEIVIDRVDETVEIGLSPGETVRVIAERKAESVSVQNPGRLVLAADTIVVLDDAILGKPASSSEAFRMLSSLSGRTHEVFTGVALLHSESGRKVVDHEVTEVTFSPLTKHEIETYVSGGSPMDKAGAYGIQDDRGSLFVRRISGSYHNVVGLPLNLIYRLLRQHFPELTIF